MEELKSKNFDILENVKVLREFEKLESTEREKLLKMIKDRYFSGQLSNEFNIDLFAKFASDIYFGIPLKLHVEDRVRRTSTPTYFYKFSHFGREPTYTDLLVKRCINGNRIIFYCMINMIRIRTLKGRYNIQII